MEGLAEGPALVSQQNLSLWGGLDPQTGQIIDKRHDLYEEQVRDTVLVFPFGKGSTTGAIILLEAVRCKKAPTAIINLKTEPILASGAMMAKIFYNKTLPVIDQLEKNPLETINTRDYVWVDGTQGQIEIYKREAT